MKINIGTTKKNIVGVEIDKPFYEITIDNVRAIVNEKLGGLFHDIHITGWAPTPEKRKPFSSSKPTELHRVLMHRDDCTFEEADVIVREMRQMVLEGDDPEDVLYAEGLEPDYIFDILPY